MVAGRLEEQKGHAVLFDALAEVRKRGLDVHARGRGRGRAARRRSSSAREQLGIGGHVHFLGALDDVGPLLAAADAVVLPSLWEGLPLVLLEAMVRSRPVVATAVGGVPEVIEDGVHGSLVPAGDVAGAGRRARARSIARPSARCGSAARAAIACGATTSGRRVAEGFEAVYDEVLGLATFTPEEPAARGARRCTVTLGVVIPCYRQERFLPRTIDALERALAGRDWRGVLVLAAPGRPGREAGTLGALDGALAPRRAPAHARGRP